MPEGRSKHVISLRTFGRWGRGVEGREGGGGRVLGWRWWRRRKYFSRSLICGRRESRPYPGDPDSLAISRCPVVSAAYRVALITILMAHQRARERRGQWGRRGVWGEGGRRVEGRRRWRHTHRGKAEMVNMVFNVHRNHKTY